jgi:multiple sugar transport system substrate-binding protein
MRKLAPLVTAAVVTVCLASCGGSATPGAVSGPQTVTMWMYPVISNQAQNDAFWNSIARGFEAQNRNITIDISEQTWASRQEAVSAAVASGKPPDLLLMIPDQVPQYAAQGALEPVGSVLGGSAGQFLPSTTGGLSFGGRLYGVPLYQDVGAPVYDKALFAQAGIMQLPETWSEMLADAPKLAARGIPLLDYSGSPQQTLNLTFYQYLWQAGGSVFSRDGKRVVVDSRQGVAALQFLVDLQKAQGMPPDAATATGASLQTRPIALGKAAMALGLDLPGAEQLGTLLGKQNVAVGMPIKGVRQVTFGNPGGLVLTSASSHKAAATKFLQYLITPKVEAEISKATGYYAPRRDVQVQSSDPWAQQFAKALPYAYAGDQNAQARKVMAIVATYVQAALLGKQSPQQALTAAAQEANSQMGGG